jgi:DNA-binding transcriptional LysR family regulator
MDIQLLRTFLEVGRTHHFGRAAQNLFITQSAVSARIRLLEDTLGVQLFTRTRNDIQLTSAGLRLKRHAETIVNAWEQARQESALEPEYSGTLVVGAVWDLWDILLNSWLRKVQLELTGIALQTEAHTSEILVNRLLNGVLDLAFMFEPPQIPELEIQQVMPINLVMLSTRPGQVAEDAVKEGYIMVDWGTSFILRHSRYFFGLPTPPIRMGAGALVLNYLIHHDGAAYLAEQVLGLPQMKDRLFRVENAPVFKRFAHAVYRPGSEKETVIRTALTCFNSD